MNKIKKTLISAIAIVGFSTSLFAFEGFSIGAAYSDLDFSTKGTETTSGVATVNNETTTKTGSGDLGSIFVEYTFAQGSTIGLDYIDGTAEIGKATRTSSTPSGDVTASASVSDPLTFYVEPTFMLTDTFGVYAKGGVTQLTVTPKEVDTASVVTSSYKAKDLNGVVTGFGAKFYMGNFFAKAEYLETEFDTYVHQSTTGTNAIIRADIDTEQTIFALGYNF
jgi:hypothetical protein